MNDLILLFEKYNNGDYDISDVSRLLSYMALPDELDVDIEKAEYKIEMIRFLESYNEQKEQANKVLLDLIEKYKNILDA